MEDVAVTQGETLVIENLILTMFRLGKKARMLLFAPYVTHPYEYVHDLHKGNEEP